MSNQSPDDFVKTCPVASTVPHEIASGDTPLPPTCLLGAAERQRLDKLAASGEAPVERPPEDRTDVCQSFSDGSFFKWLPREGFGSQCLLVDAAGQSIAIVKNANLADFLANAVNLFAAAQLKHEAEGTQMRIFHEPVVLPEV